MATNILALPADIPWRRLCVSEDMLDDKVCQHRFPLRWRSSLAVFTYEPGPDYQTYPDQTISYIKVVCSITGFQEDPTEVGLTDGRATGWLTPGMIDEYKSVVAKYYACYGAILEVAIAPATHSGTVSPRDYPYFIDVQPKKRDVYETVSESGEMTSRSLEDLNVRKGNSSTQMHEVVDSTTTSAGAGFSYVASGSISQQGQIGTRDVTQQQADNVRTTDAAREMRETVSHTTQLTQMYQVFTSYHVGTNRALFLMLPRPHVLQSEMAFVNGPRQLEGIQEVFLVAMRPKSQPGFCVEAYLETAHLADESEVVPDDRSSQRFGFEVSQKTVGLWQINSVDGRDEVWFEKTITYRVRDGWVIDRETEGGYIVGFSESIPSIAPGLPTIRTVEVKIESATTVSVTGKIGWAYSYMAGSGDMPVAEPAQPWDDIMPYVALGVEATIFLVRAEASKRLFLTGRGVCCCDEIKLVRSGVGWEGPVTSAAGAVGATSPMTAADANRLRTEIGRTIVQSVNSAERYPRGTVQFVETNLVARAVASRMGRTAVDDDVPVIALPGLTQDLAEQIVQRLPDATRATLLRMSPAEQRDRFGFDDVQVSLLRRALLNLAGPPPDPATRWNAPSTRILRDVPDVIQLPVKVAREQIDRLGFPIAITRVDSSLPAGIVVFQDPPPGARVPRSTTIQLALSSGQTVQIPSLVGLPLSRALVALRAAGYQAEPELRFEPNTNAPLVRAVEPPARSFVTPGARVVVTIG